MTLTVGKSGFHVDELGVIRDGVVKQAPAAGLVQFAFGETGSTVYVREADVAHSGPAARIIQTNRLAAIRRSKVSSPQIVGNPK